MTAKELIDYLIQDAGLDEATAQAFVKAAANEKVAARAASLKQQSEYDALVTKSQALETSLNGKDGQLGAAAYQQWYQKNYPQIQKLQNDLIKYQERYGTLESPADTPAPNFGSGSGTKSFSEDEVQAIVRKTIDEGYGARWSNLITGAGTILEKHMRSGRKSSIDWKKLGELAESKGGDLVEAYNVWDAPAAEAARKEDEDKRVEARVKEELSKRRSTELFPAAADVGSDTGPLSFRRSEGTTSAKPTYDRNKVIQSAISGVYEPANTN